MSPQYEKLAEWLLIGHAKSWPMYRVMEAVGADNFSEVDRAEAHKVCPAMPPPEAYWCYVTPVRAYVRANWPKLSDWLMANEANPQKMMGVLPQVQKLRSKGAQQRADSADRAEIAKDKAALKKADTAYHMSREAFKTHRRSAWNVCKA